MASSDPKEKSSFAYAEQFIRKAVLATEGIAGIQELPPIHDGVFITNIFGNLDVDIFVNVFWGVNIPEVSWNVQENVKEILGLETNLDPDHINIHIEGVELSNDRQ